jgi:predicted transcriptional regulator
MRSNDRAGGRRAHGALRDQVLDVLLHASEPVTARHVLEQLTAPDGSTPALTTVLTVLDRLHRSGEAQKEKIGGELRFTIARHDAEAVADDMLEALLRSQDRSGALLSFAGSLSADDLEVLRRMVGKDHNDKTGGTGTAQ